MQLRAEIFISYSSTDQADAQLINEVLVEAGFTTFFGPRSIPGGANYAVEIVKAIASCEVMVVLLSPSSIASPHVQREVNLAVDEHRALLPLSLPGTTYPTGFSTDWTYWFSTVEVKPYEGASHVPDQVGALLTPADRTAAEGAVPAPIRNPRPARRRLRPNDASPNALLRPEKAIPRLLSRETELARLEQWCHRDNDFGVRVLTGSAGQGKTRMARELASLVEARHWHTQLVDPTRPGADIVLALPAAPTLLVLDYAETRGPQLLAMLDAMLEHGVRERIRLLLLARTAADWWKALHARDADIEGLLADATVQRLEPIAENRDVVNELFSEACQEFATQLSVPLPDVVTAPYRSFGSVLDILESALAVVLGADPGNINSTNRLLSHERRYVDSSARAAGIGEVDDVDLNRIAAGLTLYGASSEDEAITLVAECNRDLTPNTRRQVARLFRRLYPGPRTYIDGLRPDALAEDLIASQLADEGQLPASQDGLNASARTPAQRRRALTMLARGATRHPMIAAELDRAVQAADLEFLGVAIDVATQVEEPYALTSAIGRAAEGRPTSEIAVLLAAVPDETVALAEMAAQMARQSIAELPEPEQQSLDDVAAAIDCSNRFSDAGWSVEAADSAQVAVDRLRQRPALETSSLQLLGRALTNLSNRLWELGELSDSIAPAREAVDRLDEAIAPANDRAAARSNLAFRLSEGGYGEEALAVARDAEAILAKFVDDDGPALGMTQGSILNNLTCVLLSTGNPVSAVEYGTRCVSLRRSQALRNRDRFLPFLARALVNAAPAAESAGHPDLADRLLGEGRALHQLTGQRAPIFRFEEAESSILAALIALHRSDWTSAKTAAGQARLALDSIPLDLRQLTARLGATIDRVRAAVTAHERLAILDVATGHHQGLSLPRLLEYRDL